MARSEEQIKKTKEFLADKQIFFQKINNIINKMMAGVTESQACIEEGVDKSKFRHLMRIDISKYSAAEATNLLNDNQIWEEKFLADLFGQDTNPLPDFDEAYKYLMENVLPERDAEIIRLKYEEEYSLREISQICNLSPERIRQIIAKTMRRLRHPHNSKYFLYGMKLSREEEEINAMIEAKKQVLKERRLQYSKMIEDIEDLDNRLKEMGYMDNIQPTDTMMLSELNLSVRAFNCLKRSGFVIVRDLVDLSTEELAHIRNLGRKSTDEIISIMRGLGYTNWPN